MVHGVLLVNPEACVASMNPAAESLTGWSTSEATGLPVADVCAIMYGPRAAMVNTVVAEVMTHGQTLELGREHLLKRKSGEVLPITGEISPIRFENGRVQGAVIVIMDATQELEHQLQLEQARRRLEQDYQTLFREMLEGFAVHEIITDASGEPVDYRYLAVNPAFERITGLTAEQMVGRTVMELMPETEPHWIHDFGRVALTGEPAFFENHSAVLGKYFEVTAFQPKPGEFACIVSDITERRQTLDKLRETQDLLEAAVAQSPSGILIADAPDVKLRLANETAAQLLSGRTMSADRIATVSHARDLNAFRPDGTPYPTHDLPLSRAILHGQVTRNEEVIIRDESGKDRWMNANAAPIRSEAGEIMAGIVVFHDITDLKEREKERQQFNVALSAKNAELEQVVYVASHDLRSPLVNIEGYSKELEYALSDLRTELVGLTNSQIPSTILNLVDGEIPEALRYIRGSASKMDTLLNGLLRLSRSGRAALNITSLDMDELMGRVLDSFEYQLRELNVQVDVSPLPPCLSDAVQVNQVFSNLVANALKYRDSQKEPRLAISGQSLPGESIYCVEDYGIGIAPDHQGKIFEIFHRLHPEMGEGEGLGLTIVRRILDRLEGDIWLESEENAGSRFFVSLPAADRCGR